jgi:hypothetical protein
VIEHQTESLSLKQIESQLETETFLLLMKEISGGARNLS